MLDKIKKRTFFKFSFYQVLTFVFFALILGGMFLAHVIWAADPINVDYQVKFGGLGSGDLLPAYINKIYKWMIGAGLALVGIMITIGGFMYLSSGGDSKTIGSGKKYIVNSLIGLLLLSSAYIILHTINPDATSMEVIEVSIIEQKTMPSGICSCDKDSDCIIPNTYCMGKDDVTPFNPEVSSDVVEALTSVFNIFMGVATLPMGVGTTIGPKIVAQGGVGAAAKNMATRFATAAAKKTADLAVRAGKLVKDKFLWAFKNPLKFSRAVVGKTVSTGFKVWAAKNVILIVGLVIIANSGFTFEFGAGCPNKDGNSMCVPNIFKYNLIPHGMAPSNEPGIGIKVNIDDGEIEPADAPRTFLYNSDGTLPVRREMLNDVVGTYAVHYFVPPLGNIEPAYLYFGGKVFPGLTNRDACMQGDKNHCPCIEWEIWEPEEANYKCKRQARCIAGNVIHPRLDDDYSYCLTGSQGEPCLTDADCRVGNQCVVIKDVSVAKGQSLFFKGIDGATKDVQGLTKDFKTATGGIYELKPPYSFQQVCMPTSGGGASGVIDSECTIADNSAYCKPGTGIKDRLIPCMPVKAAAVSEQDTSYTSPCSPLYYICYTLSKSKPVYDVTTLQERKRILRFSYTYQAKSDEECYSHYSGMAESKIKEMFQSGVAGENVIIYYDMNQGTNFKNKKYERILDQMNKHADLTIDLKISLIKQFINGLAPDMISADVKNKNNYILQQNGQCYVQLPKVGTIFLEGDTQISVTPIINLSLLIGEIGQWYHESVKDQNLKCEVGYWAMKDLLWFQVVQ